MLGLVAPPAVGADDADRPPRDQAAATPPGGCAGLGDDVADGLGDVVSVHAVRDGDLAERVQGQDDDEVVAAWEQVETVLPPDQQALVCGFLRYEALAPGVLPGDEDEIQGFVLRRYTGESLLGLDAAPESPVQAVLTVAHEALHVRVAADPEAWRCPDLREPRAPHCDQAGLLGRWVATFWDDELLETWSEAVLADADGAAEVVYDADPDRFVTEYAATSPEEDLAETYAYWSLGLEPPDDAAADKVAWLDEQPELAGVRAYVAEGDALDRPSRALVVAPVVGLSLLVVVALGWSTLRLRRQPRSASATASSRVSTSA